MSAGRVSASRGGPEGEWLLQGVGASGQGFCVQGGARELVAAAEGGCQLGRVSASKDILCRVGAHGAGYLRRVGARAEGILQRCLPYE